MRISQVDSDDVNKGSDLKTERKNVVFKHSLLNIKRAPTQQVEIEMLDLDDDIEVKKFESRVPTRLTSLNTVSHWNTKTAAKTTRN